MSLVSLRDMNEGEEAVVASIQCDQAMKTRLNDFGLLEGSKIRCLYSSVFGDPRAYLVRGTILGIRHRDAEGILCRKEHQHDRMEGSTLR